MSQRLNTEQVKQFVYKQGAELVMVGKDVTWQGLSFDDKGQLLEVTGRLDNYKLSIPLLGQYQLENATTAVATLEVLATKGFDISRESIKLRKLCFNLYSVRFS